MTFLKLIEYQVERITESPHFRAHEEDEPGFFGTIGGAIASIRIFYYFVKKINLIFSAKKLERL